jgi:hypothetical protein
MIARCQKRRRTRIAKGGQVFNEQAIWAKPELPARFCLRVFSSLRGALAAKQSSLSPGLWIASRSLSSGAHSRDPLARNDGVP